MYGSLAEMYLCSVQFVACYTSASDCSRSITFNPLALELDIYSLAHHLHKM